MKRFSLGLFIFFISFPHFSQSPENVKVFDSIFYEIAVNISSANPVKAMHMADSLYNYSHNDNQRVRALMLSADVLVKQQKQIDGIEYAIKALKIAEESKDYSFQSRIYGFMSTQYRQLGFLDKGKEYIQKGLDISLKIEDKSQVTKYQAMANHQLGDFAIAEGEFKTAIDYISLALLGYQKEENEKLRHFKLGNAEQLLGRCYIGLNNNDQAFKHFSEANELVNKSGAGNTIWAALIYQGVGDTYLAKKELDSAETYLKRALLISEESSNGILKELVFESMSKYHKERKELDSAAIFTTKHKDISSENKLNKRQVINSEFSRVTKLPVEKSKNSVYVISGLVSLILLVLSLILLKRKQLFTRVNNKKTSISNSNSLILPKKTEKELAEKLDKFEKNLEFLDKEMSFSHMVGLLNTNTRYLSHFIKTKKSKDYNTYINDLRIGYIIEKLNSNPEYLNYKISYLAKECGFSSYSNFSANFKRVVHLSPSEYIMSISITP